MAEYRFIENIRDYFNPGYFTEDFGKSVATEAGLDSKGLKSIDERFSKLSELYRQYKNIIVNGNLVPKYKIEETHKFHTELLKLLGYELTAPYMEWLYITETSVIPVRHIYRQGGKTTLLIMEMQTMIPVGDTEPDGLFGQHYDEENIPDVREQRYRFSQWEKVIPIPVPEDCKINPSIINRAIDEIFTLPEEKRRPNYILMLAGNKVFLLDQKEWHNGSYVIFDIEQLLIDVTDKQRNKNFFALFYLLCGKNALAGESETALMSRLHEASVKNAYSVTQDLKTGVVNAIETLANEAIHYKRDVLKEEFDETQESFAQDVKDDCLTIIYRLLFLFYAEAKPELGILPMKDETYLHGYSLEMLRDLEQTPMQSDETNNGYFFHDSLWRLFNMIHEGYNENSEMPYRTFSIRKIDSPLFDDETLSVLKGVKFRNSEWQKIIRELSLSQEKSDKRRGRISYSNLGINQLGSVYESLLAYRGFYAAEEFIEVHEAGKQTDETYLVVRSRRDHFKDNEILRQNDSIKKRKGKNKSESSEGENKMVVHDQWKFIYRLNGRDRKKSASYYTPEELTASTVKYTLKGYKEKLDKGEMKAVELLRLKILEPAMGAAAFQNEVINQLAEMYIRYYEKEHDMHIPADERPMEIQKAKAYIATRNTYGVDLNLTAIELGKLSLWLNVMHPNMETPYFGTHLAWGNAVIGAWLKVYSLKDVYKEIIRSGNRQGCELVKWWERKPHMVRFSKGKQKRVIRSKGKDNLEIYHFLLPDYNMLGILSVKDLKEQYPLESKRMVSIKNDWTKPITDSDVKRLRRLSEGIDKLLEGYIEYQCRVEAATANGFNVKGLPVRQRELFSYSLKQSISDTRNSSTSEYYKLKTILDYWCALWYWDFENAADIPNRDTYWNDLENIIGLNLPETKEKVDSTSNNNNDSEQGAFNFEESDEYTCNTDEPDVEDYIDESIELSAPVSKAEVNNFIKDMQDKHVLFTENNRTKIVASLADKYRFFHPMIEFIEVFWLRDGFDIICGNPPWLKWQYEPQQAVSDKYPEYVIRKEYNADKVAKLLSKTNYLSDPVLKKVCLDEQTEVECSKSLLNSMVLYPELKGSQTDLFKCILYNSIEMVSPNGYIGMVHPNTVFDEGKGQIMRKFLYPHLEYRFQYSNRMELFKGPDGKMDFNTCIYRGNNSTIKFDAIANLCKPFTIDECYNHDGNGPCLGIEYVDKDGKKQLNLFGHKERIIHYDEGMLRLVAKVFENTEEWDSCKMVAIHAQKSISILEKLSDKRHVADLHPYTSEGFHATNALKDNTMQQVTKYPNYDAYEMIFNSTQINILSPFSKLPQAICSKDSHYDIIDYTKWTVLDKIRTNYIPKADIIEFKHKVDESEQWFQRYKVGFKKMLDITHERTLKGGIIPQKASHTNSILSTYFASDRESIIFAGMAASVVLDFFIKTVGVGNLTQSVLEGLPYGIDSKYYTPLIARVLRLNCVNNWYKKLWEDNYMASMSELECSTDDSRLQPFSSMKAHFDDNSFLKTDYERRMALVEIDVIIAQALGYSLNDLIYIYTSTFNTTQKYESDTWYDKNGRVVFTANSENKYDLPRKDKNGVKGWESIRGLLSKDQNSYNGNNTPHIHTIDPSESEQYANDRIEFIPPYTRCNRIDDYKRAWYFFEDKIK